MSAWYSWQFWPICVLCAVEKTFSFHNAQTDLLSKKKERQRNWGEGVDGALCGGDESVSIRMKKEVIIQDKSLATII